MLTLDLKNSKGSPEKFLKDIEKRNQGFYKIIDDKKEFEKVETLAKKLKNNFNHFVVLGIGGSALGTICLKNALKPLAHEKLFVIDNVDPDFIKETKNKIDIKKTLFIVVSKSGDTLETLSQFFYFQKKVTDKKLDAKKHFIFITDSEKGYLKELAKKENYQTLDVPKNVGGRFSVLTAVSLFPAALIGIDIKKIITGAQKMRNRFLSKDTKKNLPFLLANTQHNFYRKGFKTNILFPYSNSLSSFSDWVRQLVCESTGKKLDNKRKKVFTGITIVPALGATDQHAQSQLFHEGPNDKLIIFFEIEKFKNTLKIPNKNLKNITFNELINIEKASTEKSLKDSHRPTITIKLDKISEETLGELFMLFEGATAFLGEFLNINAFNQPGVEHSKKLTKQAIIKL
ncbi:glucose-6-phosphate isomerase [Candidatus Peregrinibacteria bacterium CG_4_10_14_0_2_um_filter_38_24]|nr:MAG: glucose-6-phosphate isomerase [Candidatus Peregrinibacteria bacterium CG_4_10_14_0_2_um_filter_38_24]